MHEWGIATNIIDKIKVAASSNGIKRVKRAEIKLGRSLKIGVEEFLDCLVILARKDELISCQFYIEEIDSNLASLESIEGE